MAPLRNITTPPVAVDRLLRVIFTVGVSAPLGFVTRILHGEGAQPTNRALAFVLLLICSSTFISDFSWGLVQSVLYRE